MPVATRKEPVLTYLEEVPSPPEGLKEPGKARWQQMCEDLIENGNLARIFLPTVERACFCYDKIAVYQKRYDDIEAKGLMIQRNRTGLCSHPIERILRMAETQYLSYLTELGMSPKSRKNGNLPVPGNNNNPKNAKNRKGPSRPTNIDKDMDFPAVAAKIG